MKSVDLERHSRFHKCVCREDLGGLGHLTCEMNGSGVLFLEAIRFNIEVAWWDEVGALSLQHNLEHTQRGRGRLCLWRAMDIE